MDSLESKVTGMIKEQISDRTRLLIKNIEDAIEDPITGMPDMSESEIESYRKWCEGHSEGLKDAIESIKYYLLGE